MTIEGRHTDIAQESRHAAAYSFALNLKQDGGKILDIGIGDATSLERALHWLDIHPLPFMIGLDVNHSILLALPRKTNVLPVSGNSLSLPFNDKAFSLVISSQVIEHLKTGSRLKFVNELARVTEPSGKIVIATMNMDFPYNVKGHKDHVAEFNIEEAERLAKTCRGQFGNTELYVVVPSQRFVHAQLQRAKFWFLRPIKDVVPRQISELALMLLTRGEINPRSDMRADFQIKKLEELKEGELFTDFLFEIVKEQNKTSQHTPGLSRS